MSGLLQLDLTLETKWPMTRFFFFFLSIIFELFLSSNLKNQITNDPVRVYLYLTEEENNKINSAGADGGPRSRVCVR